MGVARLQNVTGERDVNEASGVPVTPRWRESEPRGRAQGWCRFFGITGHTHFRRDAACQDNVSYVGDLQVSDRTELSRPTSRALTV